MQGSTAGTGFPKNCCEALDAIARGFAEIAGRGKAKAVQDGKVDLKRIMVYDNKQKKYSLKGI